MRAVDGELLWHILFGMRLLVSSALLLTVVACSRACVPGAGSPDVPTPDSFPFAFGTRSSSGSVNLTTEGSETETEKPWQWASVTKQFVAVLVMQDVEAGRLTLSDTIEKHVPELAADGRGPVTVEQLLRHTSGLGVPRALPESMETDPVQFCRLRMRAVPGQSFEYNNCDTAVVAVILERVNGQPWAELLRRRILEPLEMKNSGVLTAPVSDGSVVTSGAPHLYGASAAMYGTLRDLLRFNDGLMTGKLLGEESLETLWDGDPKLGFVALGAWEYEARLDGCAEKVRLVERRGDVGDVQVVNVMAPALKKSMAAFTREPNVGFGEIWASRGAVYRLASQTFCGAEGSAH